MQTDGRMDGWMDGWMFLFFCLYVYTMYGRHRLTRGIIRRFSSCAIDRSLVQVMLVFCEICKALGCEASQIIWSLPSRLQTMTFDLRNSKDAKSIQQ